MILVVMILYLFLVECEQAHQSTPTFIKYLVALGSIISSCLNIILNSTISMGNIMEQLMNCRILELCLQI